MKGFVQRNPFASKAMWWKRYNSNQSKGKLIVYVATPSLGFEIDLLTNMFKACQLINGKLRTNDCVEYINITETIDNELKATKAIRLNKKLYMYNTASGEIEEEDLAEEGVEILQSDTTALTRFEKNFYVKKQIFNCSEESDQQDSSYQPISGLLAKSSYLTLKTNNFAIGVDAPATGDIITYEGSHWIISEVAKTFTYTPRKRQTLHLSMKALK